MATGDQQDFLGRLKAVLPTGWFPDESPVLDTVLSGIAYSLSWALSLITYANLQTRLLTATDVFLDIVAFDFLGERISRNSGETDSRFRLRIKREILREKATRAALLQAVTDLVGPDTPAPVYIEPRRPTDTGGYGLAMGYGVAGAYGSMCHHHQAFLTVYRPIEAGIPNVDGYGGSLGGYGVGAIEYVNNSMIPNYISDDDIYSTIAAVIPAATIIWARIESPESGGALLDDNFILDESELT